MKKRGLDYGHVNIDPASPYQVEMGIWTSWGNRSSLHMEVFEALLHEIRMPNEKSKKSAMCASCASNAK